MPTLEELNANVYRIWDKKEKTYIRSGGYKGRHTFMTLGAARGVLHYYQDKNRYEIHEFKLVKTDCHE